MCNAKIIINGQVYECKLERGDHDGPHLCQCYSGSKVIGGMDWDIDDNGQVRLNIPYYVAKVVFKT